jgi:mRNA-degrading endonuclease RelE of RelBE toxin-antitoxin system
MQKMSSQNYNVQMLAVFEKQLKRLVKKYPSLKNEVIQLITSLKQNPEQGDSLENHSYKIRLAIASKGKGKSGGARIITHIIVAQTTVFLLSIYDKAEQDDISDKELDALVKMIKSS